MSTELALHSAGSGVLQRIGTPEERQYLIQIMAEQIGIPAKDATRTDVIALLAAAAQRTIQFGWIPGIHVHVQKFETARSKEARKSNPNATPVYSYTLVVGEKAYKDSGTRWRERGVNWRYQRKPMTKEEVEEEARLQGFAERLPANAYGMWSRIIIWGQDDPANDDDPLWSAGVWLGKMKTGNFWSMDALPTGVSSRDVAIRRADKRAMMQSQLTLLPVDDLGADDRVQRLVQQLRSEAADRHAPVMERPESAIVDDAGEVWAKPSVAPARLGARPTVHAPAPAVVDDDIADGEFSWHDDVDFAREIVAEPAPEDDAVVAPEPPGARPADPGARSAPPAARSAPPAARPADPSARPEEDDPGARPAKSGARINNADAPCPECHAPVGKPHATGCAAVGDSAARPADPGARPEPEQPVARSKKSGARPEPEPIARPEPESFGARFYRRLLNFDPMEKFNPGLFNFIRHARNAEHDSVSRMTATYWKALTAMVQGEMRYQDAADTYWVLSILVGYEVDDSTRPGMLVHGYLMKHLRDQRDLTVEHLSELHAYAHDLHEAMMQEASQ